MIEISRNLKKNGDIIIIDSFLEKTSNVLKMRKNDDPYYINTGLDTSVIINYPINDEVINAYLSDYLGVNSIYPISIDINSNEKGVININIEEFYSVINLKNGNVVLKNQKTVSKKAKIGGSR